MNTNYLNNKDFKVAPYETRFKKSRTGIFKKIGILEVSFFDIDFDKNLNYIYNEKLCYLKYLKSSLTSNFTKFELREIIQ